MTDLNDMFVGLGDSTEDSWDQIERARGPAYLQHEKEAFAAAAMEHNRRYCESREQERRQAGDVAAQTAPAWMRRLEAELEQRKGEYWGFVCLLDGEAQQIDPVRLDDFFRRVQAVLSQTMLHTGAHNLIDKKWRLDFFNAAITANVSVAEDDVVLEVANSQNGKNLKKLAREYLATSAGLIHVVIGVNLDDGATKAAMISVWRSSWTTREPDGGRLLNIVRDPVDQSFRDNDGLPVDGVLSLHLSDFVPLESAVVRVLGLPHDELTASDELVVQRIEEDAEQRAKLQDPSYIG
ncbi:MAG: hypothetical protein M1826_003941 [Phylliscum demangeonii]|nr:MAG: hypothetical protein M1826_003941 [Phylliscum demangeonii]